LASKLGGGKKRTKPTELKSPEIICFYQRLRGAKRGIAQAGRKNDKEIDKQLLLY
jgi:hypothetical protein